MKDKKEQYSLKDFNINFLKTDTLDRINQFENFTNQLISNKHEIFWIESESGLKPSMKVKNIETKKEMDVLSFVSNDYLGMSQNEETKRAGIEAILKYGTGACAAPIIGGYLDIHRQLEQNIAEFAGQEDTLIFSSGYGANVGALDALLGKEDLALVDTFVHTSVLDGLKNTNIKRIGHNDLDYLELALKRDENCYKTKMVIIDGVYSQDGDLGLIPDINTLCKKYGAILFVDDAHGMGVFGNNGRGTVEHYNQLGKIDIITGTFSKSFGAVGGFVAGSRKLIQYLRYYANTNVFSAAITPQVTASVLKALELIKENQGFRQKLWDNVNYFKLRLDEEGFDYGKTASPIFPIMVRDNYNVKEITKLLQNDGIYVVGIVFPAVRTKDARLRVSLSASHEIKDIELLLKSLKKLDQNLFM